jgi:peptidoglycan/LPS O-acetylase OafA/YrhL
MADNTHTVHEEQLGPSGFVIRDAVPTSDVIRIRFADIDGLRALAILLVGFSIIVRATMHGIPPLLDHLAGAASQGLALFLVISGMALAFPAMAVLSQDGRTYIDVGRYAIRRALRIYPAYFVALVLTAAIAPFAAHFGAAGFAGVTPANFIANALFVGNGFGNDGFRAVELFVRTYLFFPALVLLWTRRPVVFGWLAAGFAILDIATPLHALSIGAFVPFMLGIVAADLRAQVHRIERYAPAVLVGGMAIAFYLSPFLQRLPGRQSAPHALDVDPFWSIAAFGLVVSVAAYRPLERIFSFWMLRVIGASSYAVSLIIVPTVGILVALAPFYAIAIAVPASFIAGFTYWQLVDRWFNDGDFRRNVASSAAPPVDDLLAKVRAARVFLGAAPPADEDDDLSTAHDDDFVPTFYAPPPRPSAADLAIVSRRTGSPEELAAEILETKARLQERSAALFAEPEPIVPEAPPPVYAKPGFYRKPANQGETPMTVTHDSQAGAAPAEDAAYVQGPVESDLPTGTTGSAIRIRISTAGPSDGKYFNG